MNRRTLMRSIALSAAASTTALAGCSQFGGETDSTVKQPQFLFVQNDSPRPHLVEIHVVDVEEYDGTVSNPGAIDSTAGEADSALSASVLVDPGDREYVADVFDEETTYQVLAEMEDRSLSFQVPYPYRHDGVPLAAGVQIQGDSTLGQMSKAASSAGTPGTDGGG